MSMGVKPSKIRFRPTVKCGPSLTVQSDRDGCDINKIIDKFKKTGMIERINRNPGIYTDLTVLPDYMESLNVVARANEAFAELSAKLRERFNNDPARMLEFLSDENNRDEAIKLGLIKKPEAPKPDPIMNVRVVKDPAGDGGDKPPK